MIEIHNLSKQYDNQPLFKGLHLTITKGSVVTLIGPSGSGKSTLLRCINGLESFQEGHISVNGQKLYGIHEQNYDKAQVHLTLKNIRRKVGMVLHNIIESPTHVLGISQAEAESNAISLLQKVHLEEKVHSYPGQLSGGQQQRVAIARALAMKPEAMLFDEPTSSLDTEMIEEVL